MPSRLGLCKLLFCLHVGFQARLFSGLQKSSFQFMEPLDFASRQTWPCNLCGHLQGCQMPDLESSRRRNSRKGCRVDHGKTAEKQPEEHPKHSCFSAVLPLPTRHPFRLFLRLLSRSGIWHPCRWPQRLQTWPVRAPLFLGQAPITRVCVELLQSCSRICGTSMWVSCCWGREPTNLHKKNLGTHHALT